MTMSARGDAEGPPAGFDYLRDPAAITARSFALVQAACDLGGVPNDLHAVALRLVHTCAMPEIIADIRASPGAAALGRAALQSGAAILVDAEMVQAGITRGRLPADNPVHCTLNQPGVREAARARGETRAAVAVERWRAHLAGSVVAIGNAPTALFRLLELLLAGAPAPALVIGFPVGFVGAAEAKAALIEHAGALPYITLRGRVGGSALAAAAVNALVAD